MTSWRRATDRAFTLVVCSDCAGGPVPSVLEQLAESIRRCRHGMLVAAPCLLGQQQCNSYPGHEGVTVLLQPCTRERTRIGVSQWIGPIRTSADAQALQAWMERGEWNMDDLPTHLRSPLNWPQAISSRN